MEVEKTVFIWVVAFLIGIGILSYRNFYSEEIRTKFDKGEKVGTISLTVITLGLLFILGKLTMKIDLLEAISKLSSIGTPLIALFAYIEYKSKTANKVNEKQLESVLEMVEYLTSKKVCRYGQRSSGKEAYKTLLEVLEIELDTEDRIQNQIIIEAEMGHREEIDNVDIERLEDFINKINYYSKKPLMPTDIRSELKKFHKYIEDEKSIHGNFRTHKIETFKISVDGIFRETQKWLHDNQVKDVRLPRIKKLNQPKPK